MVQIVDLFCGGGGFTKGCIEAGYEPVLCVDHWDKAIKFHEVNFPSIPILNLKLGKSIEDVSNTIEIFIDRKQHFHLHGSPPCNNLSTAGKKNYDQGYELVKWFLQLVEYMKPDSWSMENVSLVSKFLDNDLIPYVELNSANFGVPQIRKRIFAGQGWHAKKTHKKENWISIIQALPGIKIELNNVIAKEAFQDVKIISRHRKKGEKPQFYSLSDPSHTITQVKHKINFKLNNAGGTISKSRRCKSVDTDITNPNKTLLNTQPVLRYEKNSEFKKIRSLTIQETLILQGWENAVIPKMSDRDLFKIVGNMICPPVAKSIIEGIKLNYKIDYDQTFQNLKLKQLTLF
jgi:site-specific DNA-cytosine methylase